MTAQDAFALGRSNLNGFLFADIGVERSGMPLSVISALARQGLDPWQEAERLANEPRKTATDRLARLIAALPASLWSLPDATAIATRLVALLPGKDDRDADPQPALSPTPRLTGMTWQKGPWLIVAIMMMALLAVLSAVVAPTPIEPAADPASTAAPKTESSPQTVAPNTRQRVDE